MNKITGNGRPTVHTHGEVGQYYEDLETGDIYECRRSSEFSPLHGAPVGGYIWELRAKGEDIKEHQDIYPVLRELSEEIEGIKASGGGSGGKELIVTYAQDDNYRDVYTSNMTYDEVLDALKNDTLTGAYYLKKDYYPAGEGYTAGGDYYKTPINITNYWAEGDYIDQFVLSYYHIDSDMKNGYLQQLYLGSWGVSKNRNGEEEV